MQPVQEHAQFAGRVQIYEHASQATQCPMRFGVFAPDNPDPARAALIYLGGLTCNEETFLTKAGAQRFASAYGLFLIAPDTSPRGASAADADQYDLGQGAGFYLDAVQTPWKEHYRMHEYISVELPDLVKKEFDVQRFGIFGHSMGGHGALTLALKHPQLFRSVSAFAPICAPSQCPWGQGAFTAYLGEDPNAWREYDAVDLIHDGAFWPTDQGPVLVDQGDADEFLAEQLLPHQLQAACKDAGIDLHLRQHSGYDHGYYFISTFMQDHIRHHAKQLCERAPL